MAIRRDELSLARITAQHLCEPLASPVDVVRSLGAVQAQDLPGALQSIALRTHSRSVLEVVDAFDRGELVRNWTMRGTLHIVLADENPRILAFTGPRMASGQAARHRQLGINPGLVDRARDIAFSLLAEQGPLTRSELVQGWDDAGLVGAVPQRAVHLLSLLCRDMSLLLGPVRHLDRIAGGWEQLVVMGPGALPEPDMDWFVAWQRRFFTSHGPAHERDFARWSGMALTPVRVALSRQVGLEPVELAGERCLHAPDLAARLETHRGAAAGMHLLPGFDELVLGYQDRTPIVPPARAEAVVPGNNGMFKNTIVEAGLVVGTWRRPTPTRRAPNPTPVAQWLVEPTPQRTVAFDEAADALPALANPFR